ncbi:DUF2529 domain-containing protein [Anoxybacillus sp. LAT_35]|nr:MULTISPECIES: DUF2529 domain-containing protein [Anoxybacillus]MCG5024804.1 DUF2529 domain-containing protein [Anoxybacillus flavithermus]MCG6198959.1 DUF2529 domain-containing protein [Anoxybacillus sp. LAT_38]MCG3084869.1 DUF2529 domain-containing protein [Anoxybacillus sp. LAT27]MCG6172551.1 DUF2529 domain-containing protein [Anoxybacillus sp. LAT_11]MCG6173113.1 DUF2529 domain-containing protein [Anoxybacillus sp. LAT_11]
MLKILSTQLTGVFQRISTQEEEQFEDAARLLAQAVISNGTIFIYGIDEMEAVAAEALYGAEKLPNVKRLDINEVKTADRVLIVSRFCTNEEAIRIAKQLQEQNIWTIGMSSIIEETTQTLVDYVDVHIDLCLKQPLVPAEDGTRIGFPSAVAALFAYHSLALMTQEIVAEYE